MLLRKEKNFVSVIFSNQGREEREGLVRG